MPNIQRDDHGEIDDDIREGDESDIERGKTARELQERSTKRRLRVKSYPGNWC